MRNYFFFHDKKICYKNEGTGKTIVLLHGFTESHRIWDEFSRELSKSFSVLSIDLPGHGDSENIDEIHSMDMMAEVVNAALFVNDVSRCIMIGHSMGGYVTLEFAEKFPEMLEGFGLFHSHAMADTDEGKSNRNRIIETVKKNHKNFLNSFIPDLFAPENANLYKKEIDYLIMSADKMSKQAIIAAMAGMRDRNDKLHVLKKSKVPVLFILGRQDKRMPIEKVIEQTALPFNSEIHILGDVAHMGFIESKKESLIAIRAFAERCLK